MGRLCQYFTVMRHPIDRLISAFFYCPTDHDVQRDRPDKVSAYVVCFACIVCVVCVVCASRVVKTSVAKTNGASFCTYRGGSLAVLILSRQAFKRFISQDVSSILPK